MSLPTRPLGTSGLEITTVGFGSWAAGGGGWSFGWGPQDDSLSIAAIHRAVDLGVSWIDTAAIYGLGHSEEVVGRAVRALPAAARRCPHCGHPLVLVSQWRPGQNGRPWLPHPALGLPRTTGPP